LNRLDFPHQEGVVILRSVLEQGLLEEAVQEFIVRCPGQSWHSQAATMITSPSATSRVIDEFLLMAPTLVYWIPDKPEYWGRHKKHPESFSCQ
jgi:hypothetical protein